VYSQTEKQTGRTQKRHALAMVVRIEKIVSESLASAWWHQTSLLISFMDMTSASPCTEQDEGLLFRHCCAVMVSYLWPVACQP